MTNYMNKSGDLTTKGNTRCKQYAKTVGKRYGHKFTQANMVLMECSFNTVDCSSFTMVVPEYVMFRDTKTGKVWQVRDTAITEYVK